MHSILHPGRILLLSATLTLAAAAAAAAPQSPKFRHVASKMQQTVDSAARVRKIKQRESLPPEERIDTVRSVETILAELVPRPAAVTVNQFRLPWIFMGYQPLAPRGVFEWAMPSYSGAPVWGDEVPVVQEPMKLWDILEAEEDHICLPEEADQQIATSTLYDLNAMNQSRAWLTDAMIAGALQSDLIYDFMVRNPASVDYSIWQLPVPKRLKDDDYSARAYIESQPDVPFDETTAQFIEMEQRRILWLHNVNGLVQFSQAYLSPNWYQGGNNHLALLLAASWNVQLNQVYYPKVLLTNSISYKLGINSTPGDKFHKYSVSEDIFQWNFQAGYKAWEKWFYSFTAQLKTQLLNNYGADSEVRKASFMSPGDLTLGLGMTYSSVNAKKTFSINASISPMSYNLKTCIDSRVNAAQFAIEPGHKSVSQIGSSAEVKVEWKLTSNISYNSRLFLFTDYHYFLGDWQNTIAFAINRFLSTQIYLHLRYDSSDGTSKERWNHWMFKEILSFGLSYTFSSK